MLYCLFVECGTGDGDIYCYIFTVYDAVITIGVRLLVLLLFDNKYYIHLMVIIILSL